MNKHDEAIRLLTNGFSEMFAESVASDGRFHDLLMELADEFVSQEIPIVSVDDSTDVAYELMMRVTARRV